MRLRGGSFKALGGGAAGIASRLPLFWYGAGALALGVLLARWSWILFAPHATTTIPAPERKPATEAGRLFGVAVADAAPVQGVTLPNVALVGVFATDSKRPGFAVLQMDGKQVGVVAGGVVAPGTKLQEIHSDHVLLERGGVQQRVNLEGKAATTAPLPTANDVSGSNEASK
jgi:hypothetical protein